MSSFPHRPRALPWRLPLVLAILVTGLTLALFGLPLARTDVQDVQELSQAEFILLDQPAPPPAHARGWRPQPLPDLWSRRGLRARGGWYRLRLHLDAPPRAVQGVYLWRLNMNAAVWLNGQFLGDGGRFSEPMARNWNRPLYFTVPHALWRAGDNEILIRLATYPGFGMLAPPQVGAEALLKPRYELRQFLQNEVSAAMAVTLAVVGTFAFGLWLRRRHDSLYLWFALSSFCWAVFSAYLFVRYPPMPGPAFWWLSHVALDFWMVFLMVFLHRYLGLRHLLRERLLVATQALLALILAVPPLESAYWAGKLMHSLTLAVGFYITALAWRHWLASRWRETLVLALGLTCLILAGMHDWLMNMPLPQFLPWEALIYIWRHQFHLLYFVAPLLLLFIAWHLTGRFIDALGETERLNRDLEGRVAATRQALEASFGERRALELAQAAASERERIYQNLHDDIGAKLLTLAIGAETPQRADLARSALQDLRDVVSRSGRGPMPLSFLLADWRAEMKTRLAGAGLLLAWHQADDLPDPPVAPATALNLGRILREAVSNVLRHAQASHVAVAIHGADGHLRVCLEDDGRGPPPADAPGGRGLRNMAARAGQLGGEIVWEAGDTGGCRVRLELPLAGLEG